MTSSGSTSRPPLLVFTKVRMLHFCNTRNDAGSFTYATMRDATTSTMNTPRRDATAFSVCLRPGGSSLMKRALA